MQTKKRKSVEKANTMLGAPLGFQRPEPPSVSQNSPLLRRPPRLEQNNMSILNDIESQCSSRSGSAHRPKQKKETSLLGHMKMPDPSIRHVQRQVSDDQKSQTSKRSNKRQTKDKMLFDPGNQFVDINPVVRKAPSLQQISERSNSKSQSRKKTKVKENSLFQVQRNNLSFESESNKIQRKVDISPVPSSMNQYSSFASEAPETRPQHHKPSNRHQNNLIRMPDEPDQQRMGVPYIPASKTFSSMVNKPHKQPANGSSLLDISSQVLQSSRSNNPRQRHKLGDLIREDRLKKSKEPSRAGEANVTKNSNINTIGVSRNNGDDDYYEFTDSDVDDPRVPAIEVDHHLKVTQLKYSSTPPKNKDGRELKNQSVMFNFENEPQRRGGINLTTKDLNKSEDSQMSRGSSKLKKGRQPKEAIMLPKTDNKYFDLPVKNSPQKPNDSFYQEQRVPFVQTPKVISFDDLDPKANTVGGEREFVQKIPSMTSEHFYDRSKFQNSINSNRNPMSRPPRSVSSKHSRQSSKESSLMGSQMLSSKQPTRKVTLSELASQKRSSKDNKNKSREKLKKETSLLQFYQQSSEDNKSNVSRDSKRTAERKKQSSLINMDKRTNKQKSNNGHDFDPRLPQVVMKTNRTANSREGRDSLCQTEMVQQRVVRKNCYFINSSGKLVKDNCTIPLGQEPYGQQKQPTFSETDYGKYCNQLTYNSYVRKSSERQRSRSRSREKPSAINQNRNRSRSREPNPNSSSSSLNEFYRPRQEMRQESAQPDDFYLKHYYNTQQQFEYTNQYYGDSDQEEIERVPYNQMFTKNNSKSSAKKLPRTEHSRSKNN